ncbi:hypothetical protein SARC_03945 [Sphaeroforma arctica JP610]|uniref:Uncharacterized protein n=1 Tax=Sphaeroforma arctica JP610 TaxID=667725 RepID=A0A0L0G4T5_9EUKA|nr:hypothetical protein SARC_03945 [Sphaeroforma arctica JP610]KNC83816.1 hypothetical protein SARC_03945 [Sphaeroforma arctica JP610]|eukprot:XP_014157718.1 hypothetical protein SARC_03945 [Sphaeroforma arctica JP610]
MTDTSRYQRLEDNDVAGVEDSENDVTLERAQSTTTSGFSAAPQYEAVSTDADQELDKEPINESTSLVAHTPSISQSPGGINMDVPPPVYSKNGVSGTADVEKNLPTYEDYEKAHEHEDEFDTNLPEPYTMPIEYSMRENGPTVTVYEGFDLAIGDDSTFVATMFISFFLNWLGFLLAYVFSRTIAGKCGATSGFGLGLIKLVLVVKASTDDHQSSSHSSSSTDKQDEQFASWFMWMLVFFGWFTFVRGITIYLKYKREFAAVRSEISAI